MGGSDGSLAGWTPDLTKPVWKSSVKGAIGGMHFVEDGRTLVVAGADHRLSWVDPDTGQVLAESPISTEHVRDLTLIDGGRTLAAGGDRFIDLVDIASRKVVRTLSSDPSHHFSVAEGVEVGTLIVAGTAAAAQLWQTSPDPSTSTLNDSPDGWVLGISISGDGSRMVTTDSNGGARLWDLNSWSQMVPRRAVGAVGLRTGVLSHDGELAYFGNVTGEIQVRSGYDLSGVRSIVAFDASVTALDLSPDGRTLVAATFDGKAGLWDAQTGRKLHDLEGKRRQLHFARFTPDSRRVALVGFEPSVSLWDVASGQKLNEISSDTTAFAVAFSPDGAWMAYTGRVRRIEIARTSTLRTERTLEGHSHVPVSLAISPDGEVVAAGAADGTVRLWETRTGGALSTLHISESEISRIAFTRDGRHLIAGSREGTVWKCDLDYFDRYIAGNARYQAERQRDWIPRSTDLTAVFRWADSVLAAPPRAAAVPGKAEPPASAAP
jgi:WD40 repeat protein